MELIEPKLAMSIIVRPAYQDDGEPYVTSTVRWIGEINISNKNIYVSSDYDSESGAFIACAKHIQWYQNKFGVNLLIDALNGRVKTKKME